jgi:4-hydroxybenzoate polyprenyltransferase
MYQRERFPVFGHGLLIAAFSFSAVSFSWVLRGGRGWPPALSVLTAYVTAFLLFLQLRIADEFKDFEDDSRYQPYRPVPRGLIKLRELAVVAVVAAGVQLALALWLSLPLALLLLVTWGYLALMTREFYVRDWIRCRPVTYLWTHMLIIPLADFYATACDWQSAQEAPPPGLSWFIMVSFFNGVALEIGRKIRAPQDEEQGVRTYSHLWGRNRAAAAWLAALFVTAGCALAASARIHFLRPMALMLGLLVPAAVILAWRFLAGPVTGRARLLELFSGVWTLVLYFNLGLIPLFWRLMEGRS